MKKNKILKVNNKKSIFGLMLAFVLMISFNFTPLSVFIGTMSSVRKSEAYSSSATKNYYGPNLVTTESGFSTGQTPDGMKEYFKDSQLNYNIRTEYNKLYEKYFREYADKFLAYLDTKEGGYNGKYSEFLASLTNCNSLSEYYENNKSNTSIPEVSKHAEFRSYFESFLTSETLYKDANSEQQTLPALYDPTLLISGFYQTQIYNPFANYINNEQVAVDGTDGLVNNSDFYKDSVSYQRVKKALDAEIAKISPVFGFDGVTQDDYSVSINANNAPISQNFYYTENTFESVVTTNITYEQNSKKTTNQVYYFGVESDLASNSEYIKFTSGGENSVTFLAVSELIATPMYYRLVQENEFGYIDADHPTFYKYKSKAPYEYLNSTYKLYILDDQVTDSERATYDSLYYVDVITNDDLTEDRKNITTSGEIIDTKNCYYVQVPYFYGNSSVEQIYFSVMFTGGNAVYENSSADFKNLIDLFVDRTNKISKVYFKVTSTQSTKKVYVKDMDAFNQAVTDYKYDVELLELGGEENLTMDDFKLVTSADSPYYTEKYPELYFKKTRTYYTNTSTEYGDLLTVPTPSVSYEDKVIASPILDQSTVYSLQNTYKVGDVEYKVVSKDVLEKGLKGLYVLIDPALSPSTTNKFFHKHNVVDGAVDSTYEEVEGEKVFYVYVEETEIGGKSYPVITDESLELIKDLYVEVTPAKYLEINGENNANGSSKLYYKHNEGTAKKIFVVASDATALNKEVYKSLGYEFVTSDDFKKDFFKYVAIPSTDVNYNKNFSLYYKVDSDVDTKAEYQTDRDLFVHNEITDKNAIYIVDDSLTSTDKATYRTNFYTPLTTKEFNANADFYVLINENDENYSSVYTKLYYKYASSNEAKKDVYLYSTSSSSVYKTFTSSDTGYDPNAYVKVQYGDPDYVKGLDLYYKKEVIRTEEEKETKYNYYYYQTSSALELKSNKFYAISFYVYTNGNYFDETNTLITDNQIQTSVYFKDSNKAISDISIENISTNGKWVQYTTFVATNALSASNIVMYFKLGNEETIAGTTEKDKVNGLVIFDNIKVTLIGETDYQTKAIDGEKVSGEVVETDKEKVEFPIVTDAEVKEIEGRYELITDLQIADDKLLMDKIDDVEYKYYYKLKTNDSNEVLSGEYELDEKSNKAIYVYVEVNDTTSTTRKLDVITETRTFNNVDKYKNESIVVTDEMLADNQTLENRVQNDEIFSNWNTTFDFDNYLADADHADLENLPFDEDRDGFNADMSDWHYYISRGDSGQGNNETLKAIRNAYLNGKAEISLIEESTIDKTIKEKEEDKDDEDKEEEKEEDKKEEDKKEDKDVPTIGSTFNDKNKVLFIENKDKVRSLGIASKNFTVKQNEYFKVTVWIYSNDEDSTATIKVQSVLKTSATENQGSLVETSSGPISAYFPGYKTAPTNEYSWIPVSFYIEGNAYHNQEISLVLLSNAKSKVYFDNITIERTTSSNFDTAKSDSDAHTFCLSLSPSSSLISSGITNGYFDLSTVTSDKIDYSTPNTAENWKVVDSNTKGAVAGVVPTSEDYIRNAANAGEETFFDKYNNGKHLSTTGFANNVFAIYAPEQIAAGIKDAPENVKYNTRTDYKLYSASTSIAAGKVYEISFEVATGSNFTGNIVSTLYFSSVSAANTVGTFKIATENTSGNNSNWTKYTYYVLGGTASTSVYLEIGVQDAVGVAFFQKASCVASSYTTLEEARAAIINLEDYNNPDFSGSLADYPSLSKVRFADLSDSTLSLYQPESEKYENVYPNTNYANADTASSTYTVGESGTVISSFYETTESVHYTASIANLKFIKDSGTDDSHDYSAEVDADKVYYIKPLVADAKNTADFELYSDSMFTIKVVGFDINYNGKVDDSEIGNYEIKLVGDTVKVIIDEEETATTEVKKTNYKYNFTNDISMGNVLIPASELNNDYSSNVLVIANNNITDYTLVTPSLKGSLSSKAYYVLRVYAKVGNISLYNEESDKNSGLNISIDSVTVNWNNIKENGETNVDANGFTCYEIWITTNASSFSELKVKFSLGSKESTCSGYAIIADVQLEKFATQTLFDEYVAAKEELYAEDDTNSVAKRFFGKEDSSSSSSSSTNKEKESSIWATFFYLFSSLLLFVVLMMAFVGIYFKKHPLRLKKSKAGGADEIIVINPTTDVKEENAKSKKEKKQEAIAIEVADETTTSETAEESAETLETAENAETTEETTEAAAETTEIAETVENSEAEAQPAEKKDEKDGF